MTKLTAINTALKHPDCSWGFFQVLDNETRTYMDELLVRDGHPLAYKAGNQWNRFQTLHRTGHQFDPD